MFGDKQDNLMLAMPDADFIQKNKVFTTLAIGANTADGGMRDLHKQWGTKDAQATPGKINASMLAAFLFSSTDRSSKTIFAVIKYS